MPDLNRINQMIALTLPTKSPEMKKSLLFAVLAALVIISCNKEEPKDYTAFAGKITNPQSDSVFLYFPEGEKAFALNDKGEFYDTIQLDQKGYFYFSDGREQSELFLFPGDSIFLSVDTKQFDETLTYSGTGAEKNNYLAKKFLKEEKVGGSSAELFSMGPVDFQKKFKQHTEELEKELDKSKTEKEFKEIEKRNLKYGYLSLVAQYPDAHEYFIGKKPELPAGFLDELNGISYDNQEDYELIPYYKDLIINKYMIDIENAKSPEALEKMVTGIKSKPIKQDLVSALYYRISSTNPDSEKLNEIIQKHATDGQLKMQALQKTNAVKTLLTGKPSPKFSYQDINGKKVSLDDFKGKLVYIDVWATWCGPCIQEIPALKKLKEDYKGKNVEIISISIDVEKDFEKWKKMVADEQLKGVQLFADKDWKSEFIKAYGIDAIPRFILIDQNGNILNADAPRPSSPQIREAFDKELKG